MLTAADWSRKTLLGAVGISFVMTVIILVETISEYYNDVNIYIPLLFLGGVLVFLSRMLCYLVSVRREEASEE